MCRHELRSRFDRVFSSGFPAVKKCSLCAPLLDTSICSPLTGYVTPLPNPTTYATKIGAKGTGRLILTKLGLFRLRRSVGVSESKTIKSSQAAHTICGPQIFLPVCCLKRSVKGIVETGTIKNAFKEYRWQGVPSGSDNRRCTTVHAVTTTATVLEAAVNWQYGRLCCLITAAGSPPRT